MTAAAENQSNYTGKETPDNRLHRGLLGRSIKSSFSHLDIEIADYNSGLSKPRQAINSIVDHIRAHEASFTALNIHDPNEKLEYEHITLDPENPSASRKMLEKAFGRQGFSNHRIRVAYEDKYLKPNGLHVFFLYASTPRVPTFPVGFIEVPVPSESLNAERELIKRARRANKNSVITDVKKIGFLGIKATQNFLPYYEVPKRIPWPKETRFVLENDLDKSGDTPVATTGNELNKLIEQARTRGQVCAALIPDGEYPSGFIIFSLPDNSRHFYPLAFVFSSGLAPILTPKIEIPVEMRPTRITSRRNNEQETRKPEQPEVIPPIKEAIKPAHQIILDAAKELPSLEFTRVINQEELDNSQAEQLRNHVKALATKSFEKLLATKSLPAIPDVQTIDALAQTGQELLSEIQTLTTPPRNSEHADAILVTGLDSLNIKLKAGKPSSSRSGFVFSIARKVNDGFNQSLRGVYQPRVKQENDLGDRTKYGLVVATTIERIERAKEISSAELSPLKQILMIDNRPRWMRVFSPRPEISDLQLLEVIKYLSNMIGDRADDFSKVINLDPTTLYAGSVPTPELYNDIKNTLIPVIDGFLKEVANRIKTGKKNKETWKLPLYNLFTEGGRESSLSEAEIMSVLTTAIDPEHAKLLYDLITSKIATSNNKRALINLIDEMFDSQESVVTFNTVNVNQAINIAKANEQRRQNLFDLERLEKIVQRLSFDLGLSEKQIRETISQSIDGQEFFHWIRKIDDLHTNGIQGLIIIARAKLASFNFPQLETKKDEENKKSEKGNGRETHSAAVPIRPPVVKPTRQLVQVSNSAENGKNHAMDQRAIVNFLRGHDVRISGDLFKTVDEYIEAIHGELSDVLVDDEEVDAETVEGFASNSEALKLLSAWSSSKKPYAETAEELFNYLTQAVADYHNEQIDNDDDSNEDNENDDGGDNDNNDDGAEAVENNTGMSNKDIYDFLKLRVPLAKALFGVDDYVKSLKGSLILQGANKNTSFTDIISSGEYNHLYIIRTLNGIIKNGSLYQEVREQARAIRNYLVEQVVAQLAETENNSSKDNENNYERPPMREFVLENAMSGLSDKYKVTIKVKDLDDCIAELRKRKAEQNIVLQLRGNILVVVEKQFAKILEPLDFNQHLLLAGELTDWVMNEMREQGMIE